MDGQTFWKTLKKPIIGLAPMDGVTDPAFRFIIDSIGHPDILFTEFVSSEGLSRGILSLTRTFRHHESKTPLIGQIFGGEPTSMYCSAVILCAIGMDGIDINMGCPNRHITKSGGGAALMQTPDMAKKIIRHVRQACTDWKNGIKLHDLDMPSRFTRFLQMNFANGWNRKRAAIPVSVKTRIGFDKPDTVPWIHTLLEEEPDAITLHGRTLIQMYEGRADWHEIQKAAALARKTNTVFLGNGDIISYEDAQEHIRFSPDGVLIGRSSWGNPWVFTKHSKPSIKEKIRAALLHCDAFMELTPKDHVLSLRKHMAWYLKGFPNATDIRTCIMKCETLEEIKTFLQSLSLL